MNSQHCRDASYRKSPWGLIIEDLAPRFNGPFFLSNNEASSLATKPFILVCLAASLGYMNQ